ncbi:hypothetical protein OIU34_21375 [Pararhizobium sp. BT-229]|uniref:hypothetical protein n=1 Tax=Pararhizobium sp. BT-229 TaxID=2986923 RepID=UPI0021F764EB|nr:hypothetical protein [Pararhizobium sp. BT-229]MCV9964444.1 hypothetical protein [Pararhizobium sp. BT-229]
MTTKSTSLALIDIEAEERGRSLVSADTVRRVSEVLGVVPRVPAAALEGDLRVSVEAVLGEDVTLTDLELAALRRSTEALPRPAEADSFAWNSVKKPSDVDPLVRAVMIYHRFNVQAVAVSEKIGANDAFRRFVRQYSGAEDAELKTALEAERRHVDRISSFMEFVGAFVEKASEVFEGEAWTIGSVLVLTGAVGGFVHSRDLLSPGWRLLMAPSDRCLDEVEGLRMELAYFAREVQQSHGINLLGYSLSSLSGVRRSLFDGGADFQAAMSTFGVEEDDEARLVSLAGNVRAFIETYDRLCASLEENGYRESDLSGVTAHVLMRKYLMEAAEASGVAWDSVRDIVRPRAVVSGEVFAELMGSLENDTFSAKLDNISRDRGQGIANVVLASEHYVYSRLYWIDAGERVVSCDPGIRMMDLRSILEMEPEIHGNSEILARAGVVDRRDVEVLEQHLSWLIGVYGMPVPNAAINRIIASKGVALEGLLTEP